MVDREIINEWISKADDDFEFAKINLQEEKPFSKNEADKAFRSAEEIRHFLKAKLQL